MGALLPKYEKVQCQVRGADDSIGLPRLVLDIDRES